MGLTAAVTLLTLSLRPTDAAVMLAPGTTLPGQDYIDYGAQFQNSMVGIKRVSPTNGAFGFVSGVQIDERHVITSAHGIDTTAQGFWPMKFLFSVVGTNLYTPASTTPFRRMSVHPSYGRSFGTGIDLVVIELEEALPGRGSHIADNSVASGELLVFAGFGQFALVDGALQPVDGFVRAFDATATNPSPLFDNYYYSDGYPNGLLPGKGANRDSGGGVYFGNDLVGIIIAVGAETSSSGRTTFLDLTRPEIRSWIAEFQASSVGGALGFRLAEVNITPASGGQGPRVSGKVHGGPGLASIRIEASSTLGAGAVWETIGTVTLDQSGSATFADLLDNRPEALGATKSFYRAATVP